MVEGNGLKKSVGYRLDPAAIERIKQLAGDLQTSQTNILETWAASGTHPLAMKRLRVVNANPLALSGDSWEGGYTGRVRIEFDVESTVAAIEVDVKMEGYGHFVNRLAQKIETVTDLLYPY